ncbi:Putative NAD(P)H nitroreductase MhqN [Polystyrenella longa]|uniref:NAD(P)H nitroreductase MhqN n=1 Tax=Polystyrenella longa TaxID=2528007 RepID=A0A518CI87_9PLAN|nr:nitroreductase family protein [Polystyrenella longa]QDU78941.1 Putative NAD(P)H nitroreductase MhqN [Polystyrenella longa]
MDVIEAIQTRRAIKSFDPEFSLNRQDIEQLISVAKLAPSAFNIQHYRIVAVQDKELLQQISEAANNQPQVTQSSVLFVLCADMQAWKKEPERYWSHVDEKTQQNLANMIRNFYDGRDQLQRDEAIRSSGLIAQTIMLTAKGMGLDSCPMDGFDFEKVGQLIKLPEDHLVAMFVAVGKADGEPKPRGGKIPLEEVLIWDQF